MNLQQYDNELNLLGEKVWKEQYNCMRFFDIDKDESKALVSLKALEISLDTWIRVIGEMRKECYARLRELS